MQRALSLAPFGNAPCAANPIQAFERELHAERLKRFQLAKARPLPLSLLRYSDAAAA